MMTSSAERVKMPVTDAFCGKRARHRVRIELRRHPRPWDRAHVHQQRDVNLPQESDEFGERPRGVTDGEDGIARLAIHVRSFVSAAPLCIAMWSVVSLLVSYCGSSLLACAVQPLNCTGGVTTRVILARTRTASEFHET